MKKSNIFKSVSRPRSWGESPLVRWNAEDYVTKSSENFPATTEDATQALAGIYRT